MVHRAKNPFRPGAGTVPPKLTGRDPEIAQARAMLATLAEGQPPPEGKLYFGPRGNGKTVLLARIADEARRLGLRTERFPVSAFRTHEALRDALGENAGATGAVTANHIPKLFASWVQAAPRPLVILVDEIQTIPPDVARAFLGAVQEAATDALPFCFLAAGTPDAPRRLRKAGTFTERMFEQVPVGRLDRAATTQALDAPATESGLPFGDEAVALLATRSLGYPYFIQLLGSAASARNADRITPDLAAKGVSAAEPRIQRFYSQRWSEARGHGVDHVLLPLAELLPAHPGQLDDEQLDRVLASAKSPMSRADLLDTLTDLGVLWETPSGGWEMGIPSFADYVLRRSRRPS